MTNTFKKSLFIVLGCLVATITGIHAQTPIADLSFEITNSTSSLPSNYVYSSTQSPSITTQNSIKCIQISNGGGSEAPDLSAAPSAGSGKRWMAFCPAADCSVTVSIMSNKKEFYIQDKSGKFFTYTNTANAVEEQTITGLKAGKWYAFCGGSSQVYITKATFTAAAPPVAVDGVIVTPATLELEAGETGALTATVSPSDATNKKVTWTSNNPAIASVSETGVVKGESVGNTTIVATTADGGYTDECSVTVKAATPVPVTGISLTDKTIQLGATAALTITYQPSNANTGKECTWNSSDPSVATVNNGNVTGIKAGTTTITATSKTNTSITATCVVTVSAADPVPATDLTLHQPGIYEEKTLAGGYNTPMTVYNDSAYEVYYCFKGKVSGSSVAAVATTPGGTFLTDNNQRALDGWFDANPGSMEESGAGAMEEFVAGNGDWKMKGESLKLHVKGYDLFKILAADNDVNNTEKQFHVFLNNKEQTSTPNTSPSTRSYELNPSQEYLIEVKAGSSTQIKFYGFSLREAQIPHLKYIKGNDSTQVVLQTQAPKAVYYYTKYNSKGETKLEWDDAQATGITLTKQGSAAIGDTLVLGGVANCPTGDYKYNVVTYMNGQETSRASGKFKVISDIKVKSESTTVDAYQQEEMEEIEFRYYALDASAITLSWKDNNAPAGITTSDDATEHIFTISGTPTAPQGDYPFSVTIAGSETVITGVIKVWSSDLGENPVLYLYKTKGEKSAYDNDGIYEYLKSKDVNLIPRTAIKKLRSADQYAKFKWILISEDVDADNEEVLEIIKGGSGLPVLNLKGFTYTADRLGWGEPDNGTLDTISNNGCNIFIEREDHPIFESFNLKHGAKLQIFNKLQPNSNGVMPINIDLPGSLCLATAYTRNIEYYYQDGELQTVIHEIPADQREGKKYICVPLAMSNSKNLSADGKKLFNEIVKYLMDDTEYPVSQRTLKINSFRVNNLDATIKEDRIDLVYDAIQHPEMNIKALAPEIVLEDELTHVTPASGDTIDFTYSLYMPVVYVVTDFINRHVYEVVIQAYGSQGLEEITYTVGEWVNIYDIYGRLIATTNENIHMINLPRGMYIAVTENGKSIKLMK